MSYVIKSGPKKGMRDYAKEARLESDTRKKERSNRNKARYALNMSVGNNKHVDHIDGNPLNNSKSNLRVVSAKANLAKEGNSKKRKAKA
jgi:hypothetical protein